MKGRFIPREKMSKKARKKAAAERRGTWGFSPVTKKIDSRKVYNRKRISRAGYDDGAGDFYVELIIEHCPRQAGY